MLYELVSTMIIESLVKAILSAIGGIIANLTYNLAFFKNPLCALNFRIKIDFNVMF